MDRIFLTVVNMSLTASFVIAVVMMARLVLRRAPKIISYALWAVVLFNLVCPFKPESALSLMPFNSNPVSQDAFGSGYSSGTRDVSVAGEASAAGDASLAVHETDTALSAPTGSADRTAVRDNEQNAATNNEAPGIVSAPSEGTPASGPSAGRALLTYGSYLWALGASALLLYAIVGYVRLKRRMALAVRVENNVYETDRADSPFVLGLFRPRIYIPVGLYPGQSIHIIEHERTHIRRRDNIVSVAAFAALALHWFNPLVWAAYMLMLRDMESSCDEAVLRKSSEDIRRSYSSALLGFSSSRKQLSFPLAFGEQSVKGRIKNVLNFKKPSRFIIVAAVILVVVLSMGFALNRVSVDNPNSWELYTFPYFNYHDPGNTLNMEVKVNFNTDEGTYPRSVKVITARLTNVAVPGEVSCGKSFILVKQVGDEWRVVPFKDGVAFNDIGILLSLWQSEFYTLERDMFAADLTPGSYRIVTDVWYGEDLRETLTVWAHFLISETDGYLPETMPPEATPLPGGTPPITVQADGAEIVWAAGISRWDGVTYDGSGGFREIMSQTAFDDLTYIRNGETVTILFPGRLPDSLSLTEHLLRENGDEKFNLPGMEYIVTLESFYNRASFTIMPNSWTALSSASHDYYPGNTIKGYSLVCTWDDNVSEYVFVIRGDAWITMVPPESAQLPNDSNEVTPDPLPPEPVSGPEAETNDNERDDPAGGQVANGAGLEDEQPGAATDEPVGGANAEEPGGPSEDPGDVASGTEPNVPASNRLVSIEEWEGISASALELIFEDEHSRYYLTSIRSHSIMLTFEDGQHISLADAMGQQMVTIEELVANGLDVITMERGDGSGAPDR